MFSVAFLIKHSQQFVTFLLPCSNNQCIAPDLDYTLIREFRFSKSLHWMYLTDKPLSTLAFLRLAPNSKCLSLSGCKNLVHDNFFILGSLEALQKLFVSFTAVTAETLFQIVRNKYITVLDVYGVHLSVAACNSILNSVQNIKSLSISLDSDILEP